jgi:hypothetical protein
MPRVLSIDAFVMAYGTLGYAECVDGSLEAGTEKIALYAQYLPSLGWEPTHAAGPLPSGCWTSKPGPLEDIDHLGVAAVADGTYGQVVRYLKRKRTS